MPKTTFLIRCRILVVHEDKLLVVKHSPEATFYALPGGHMEIDENPLECIKREIKEELGVDLDNPELKYIYTWKNTDEVENVEFLFLTRDTIVFDNSEKGTPSHAFEIVDTRWVSRDDELRILPTAIIQEFRDNGFVFDGVRFISN